MPVNAHRHVEPIHSDTNASFDSSIVPHQNSVWPRRSGTLAWLPSEDASGAAGCGARQHLFAGLADIGEAFLHAGPDAAAARPRPGAILFDVRPARLPDCGSLEQDRLARLGEVFEMLLDAGPDPSFVRLDACALRLDIGAACFRDRPLCMTRRHAGGDDQSGAGECQYVRTIAFSAESESRGIWGIP